MSSFKIERIQYFENENKIEVEGICMENNEEYYFATKLDYEYCAEKSLKEIEELAIYTMNPLYEYNKDNAQL